MYGIFVKMYLLKCWKWWNYICHTDTLGVTKKQSKATGKVAGHGGGKPGDVVFGWWSDHPAEKGRPETAGQRTLPYRRSMRPEKRGPLRGEDPTNYWIRKEKNVFPYLQPIALSNMAEVLQSSSVRELRKYKISMLFIKNMFVKIW